MRHPSSLLVEAVLLGVLGCGFALVANHFSPRGLLLGRDYFPNHATAVPVAPLPAGLPVASGPTNSEVQRSLEQKGLSVVDGVEAEKLFRDPQYEQELILFIDARDDHHYEEGHIPGAYQFDRYYPEKHLPVVLPACVAASRIVVYCTGGKCEDSEFAALALVEAGIPAGHVSVYLGGMTDWAAAKRPVETGPRKSGVMRPETP